MKILSAAFLLLLGLGLSTAARADTVNSTGIKFVAGQPFFTVPAGPVTGTAGAPGFAQGDWNNLSGNSGSASGLINSSGQTTGIDVTWSSIDAWQALSGAPATQNAQLMNGYLDNTIQITATGIPYGSYEVVVYFNGDTPSQNRVSQYQIGSTSIFAQDNAAFGGTFIQVPSTSNADLGTSTPAGNYVIFNNLSGSSFTLDATPGSTLGTPRAVVNAIQIVPTPEPLTSLLLLAGLVCLGSLAFVRARCLAASSNLCSR
jgi:hypothetical protein